MKIVVAIVLFFCITDVTIGQNAKIDSFNLLIKKATSDTARINLVNKKIKVLSGINIDSGIALGKKTLEESQRLKYYQGEITTRLKLATNYCFKGEYEKAAGHLQFLERFIKPTKDSADMAYVYSNYGMMQGMKSNYDSSIRFYEKSIGIQERHNNKTKLGSDYTNISIAYQQQSNFMRAMYYLQKGLKNAEDLHDGVSQSYTLTNMGNTYDMMDDSIRAERSFLKAILLSKENTVPDVELYSYTNLSSLYINGKNWQKGYEYGMKSATLAATMGDEGIHAASLSKAAIALANMNRFDEALALAQKSLTIADSSKQPLNIYQAYAGMGSILRLQKKYREAIPYYEKSLIATKNSDIYTVNDIAFYKELSDCYEQTGNYPKALQVYKKSAEVSDSVKSKDNIRKATELGMNYEFEKKEALSEAIQHEKNAAAKLNQLLLLSALGLTLILVAVVWVSLRHKQQANIALTQQADTLQKTLTQLTTMQAKLIQSEKMASLGELTAGIAHEIQNPLNFVNNFSDINTELIAEMMDEINNGNMVEVKALAEDIAGNEYKINHHGKRADGIVKGMLQHSRSNTGVKEPTNINTLADEYLRLAYHGLRAKDKSFNAKLVTAFDPAVPNINIIPQDMGRVVINLITNAFHAVSDKKKIRGEAFEPVVTVSTNYIPSSGEVQIKVKDNGSGIPQRVLDKIFQPFFTTKPTGEGTGLGLSMSYDIITSGHNGTINVETVEGEGSEFIISLPA
ncbi:MAG: tetratricopeptide repeat protein [Ferruginibacter sp.]